MQEDTKIGLLVKFVSNGLKRALDNSSVRIGLTATQCQTMGFLRRKTDMGEKAYPMDLEKELHLKKSTVSGVLKRMEEKGFIKLQSDDDDGRRKIITLTPKSKEIDEKMEENFRYVEGELLTGIDEEDIEITKRTLLKMLDNINKFNDVD